MRVHKGFNLTPAMSDLAPHRHEEQTLQEE